MFNSLIYIRGIQKPIITSKSNAESIQRVFDDKNVEPSFVIRVGNQSFRKSEIKYIAIERDSNKAIENDIERNKFYEEEKKNYSYNSTRSIEEKSKKTGMFEMVYVAIVGVKPTREIINKVIEVQRDFFTKNRSRVLCDFNLLKSLVDENKKAVPFSDKVRKTQISVGVLGLVERAIFRDMQLAGQLK